MIHLRLKLHFARSNKLIVLTVTQFVPRHGSLDVKHRPHPRWAYESSAIACEMRAKCAKPRGGSAVFGWERRHVHYRGEGLIFRLKKRSPLLANDATRYAAACTLSSHLGR